MLFEDLETGSVWSQLAQEAIKGPLKGTELKSVPALQTTWRHWKSLHPDTLVLSPKLGVTKRSYEYVPSGSGEEEFIRGMRARELVLALDLGTVQKAYPFRELKKAGGTVEEVIEGQWIQVVYDEKSKSALARDENGHLLAAFTAYWKHWVEFHQQTEIYEAKKKSLRGTIDSFDRHQRMLYVSTGNDTQPHSFELGERTELKWKKDLSWADLAVGLQVEIKFVEGVRKALEIKVLSGSGKRD